MSKRRCEYFRLVAAIVLYAILTENPEIRDALTGTGVYDSENWNSETGPSMNDEKIILNFSLVIFAVVLPVIIGKMKGGPENEGFSLKDLSKVSSIVLLIYTIYYSLDAAVPQYIENIPSFIIFRSVIAIIPLAAVIKASPLGNSLRELILFPIFKRNSAYYIILLVLFVYYASGSSFLVRSPSLKSFQNVHFLMTLRAMHHKPLFTIPPILISMLLGVISEEVMCRYFAINALRQRLSRNSAIVISSLIWTLLHWGPAFNIFIVGIFLAYFYTKTESLSLCVLLHFLYNLSFETEALYFFSNAKGFAISPIQYFAMILAGLIVSYFLVETVFRRAGRVMSLE